LTSYKYNKQKRLIEEQGVDIYPAKTELRYKRYYSYNKRGLLKKEVDLGDDHSGSIYDGSKTVYIYTYK
jgi:hypothetical protein